jgi:heat shock protein HtpX
MKGGKNNPGPMIALVGIVLLIVGYIVFPLLKLAISRKREYLADAGAVELTKDAHAMVIALQKIS